MAKLSNISASSDNWLSAIQIHRSIEFNRPAHSPALLGSFGKSTLSTGSGRLISGLTFPCSVNRSAVDRWSPGFMCLWFNRFQRCSKSLFHAKVISKCAIVRIEREREKDSFKAIVSRALAVPLCEALFHELIKHTSLYWCSANSSIWFVQIERQVPCPEIKYWLEGSASIMNSSPLCVQNRNCLCLCKGVKQSSAIFCSHLCHGPVSRWCCHPPLPVKSQLISALICPNVSYEVKLHSSQLSQKFLGSPPFCFPRIDQLDDGQLCPHHHHHCPHPSS